jgi:hypothetical protein
VPEDLFAPVPKLVSDVEPVLCEVDHRLEDEIVQLVRAAVARHPRQSLTRELHSSSPYVVEVVLRLLVVERLHGWRDEEAEHFVGDSLGLRRFCWVSYEDEAVPDDTSRIRWASLPGLQTVERLRAEYRPLVGTLAELEQAVLREQRRIDTFFYPDGRVRDA